MRMILMPKSIILFLLLLIETLLCIMFSSSCYQEDFDGGATWKSSCDLCDKRSAQKATSALSKLFVYGALKYGQPSNSILASTGNGYAKFWCKATTTQKLPLVIATRYNIPFLLNKPGVGYYVTGEIYEVDDRMLKSLDNLEDCQDVINREKHDMNIGVGEGTVPCWVYLLHKYPEKLLTLPYLSGYENSAAYPYIQRHRRTHKHPVQDDLSYEAQN